MYKTVIRAAPRRIASSRAQQLLVNSTSRSSRFISTAPPARKSRSLKSSLARWGLAGGIVYFYINNDLFADKSEAAIQSLDDSIHNVQESKLPTLDAIVEEKRLREIQQAEENKKTEGNVEKVAAAGEEGESQEGEGGLEGLEEEAGQQGAFNPETGEINWECPCLGGMAHGPCGEEFRAAFSCFVYSTEEPKGVECIDKFKGMQDCFRAHPDIYGAELEEDEDELEDEIRAQEAQKAQDREEPTVQEPDVVERDSPAKSESVKTAPAPTPKAKKEVPAEKEVKEAAPKPAAHATGESEEAVPKAAYDATSK